MRKDRFQAYQVIVDEDQANLVYTQLTQGRDDTLLKDNAISRDTDDAARDSNNQALALVNLDIA